MQRNELPEQSYWVRGEGTRGTDNVDGAPYAAMNVGRFQDREGIVKEWDKIGMVIQGAAIKDYTFDKDYYLEVASLMSSVSDAVTPWQNNILDNLVPAKDYP